MADQETSDMLELIDLRSKLDGYQRAELQREITYRVLARADKLAGGRPIHHPLRDGGQVYKGLPVSTRMISENFFKLAVDEIDKEVTTQRRERERQERHQEFLRKKAESEESERQRIKSNFTKIIAAGILPESWDSFTKLPSELKTKLLGELGGTSLLTEYKVKEASGLSWAGWKALIEYDPNANSPEAASNGDKGTPPENDGKAVSAPEE